MRRPARAGTVAVEFAMVASAFVLGSILVMEAAMQLLASTALDAGAREASRFGITGQTAPPGMSPPPATREDALRRIVLQRAGGLLKDEHLRMTVEAAASFSALGTPEQVQPGAGGSGQVARYTLMYDQSFVTGFAAALVGRPALRHSSVALVRNEPFAIQ
jgi:hypothetical protein